MNRLDRLSEIEWFWKSEKREHQWNQARWEPYIRQGADLDLKSANDIHKMVCTQGYAFWTMGLYKSEIVKTFNWECALLDWLHVWHSMPEKWNAPLFINKHTKSICIPYHVPQDFTHLFQKPNSVLLGMESWETSRRDWRESIQVKIPNRLTNAGSDNATGQSGPVRPVSIAEALSFLTK